MIGHTKSSCFVTKKSRGKVGWKWSILMVMVVCFCGLGLGVTTRDVSAGAKIGKDGNMGSGSTVGGGGGSSGGCERGSASSGDCMGVSWIYFEATTDATSEVEFYPQDNDRSAVKIPKECSEKGRGFWAFGIGGLASFNQPNKVYSFVNVDWDVSHNIGLGTSGSRYSTDASKHGFRNGIKPWAYQGSRSTPWIQGGYYTTYGKDTLNHVLYVNGEKIYEATKYGHIGESKSRFIPKAELDENVKNSTVFAEFKKAWKAEYGQEYPNGYTYAEGEAPLPADNFPSWLDYFCYWDGMGNVTLTTSAQSVNGTVLRNEEKQTVPVSSPVSKDYGDKIGNYKFKKWVNTSGDVSVTGSALSVQNLKEDRSFTAIYYDPVTLKASVTTDSDSIVDGGDSSFKWSCSQEVAWNEEAKCSPPTGIAGFTFRYWKNADGNRVTTSCSGVTTSRNACVDENNNLIVKNLQGNRSYQAVIANRKVTFYYVDENYTIYLKDPETTLSPYGLLAPYPPKIASMYLDLYTFKQWERMKGDEPSVLNNTLYVDPLTKNSEYRAVYWNPRTLVGIPIEYGTGANIENHIQRMVSTVRYNTSASITTSSNPSYNWVFQCWSTNYRCDSNNGLLSTSLTYSATLTSDVIVNAVYRRVYHVSFVLKNVLTRENFNNLQVDVDDVNKYSTLAYSGGPYGNVTYNNGVWEGDVWRGDAVWGELPGEIEVGGVTYRRVGWYSVKNDPDVENVRYCSDTTVRVKEAANPIGSNYTFGTNSSWGCLAIWGAYVPVRNLTALAHDTSGNYIGDRHFTNIQSKWSEDYKRIYDQRITVFNGESASLTRYLSRNTYTDVGYIFKGWKTCQYSWCEIVSTDPTYSISSLTMDGVIYPVYELKPLTLKIVAVDDSGHAMTNWTDTSGDLLYHPTISDVVTNARYWDKNVTAYARSAPDGWTFGKDGNGCFKSSTNASTCDRGTGTTYTVSGEMTSDVTVYAMYVRNEFAGRVRVSGGTSVNESSNTSTGWVETNKSTSLTIECPNDGCDAAFDLSLKTIKGLGKTLYSVSSKKNTGNYGVVRGPSWIAPSYNDGTKIGGYTSKLYPGETLCYKLTFMPYGIYTNPETADVEACISAKESKFQGKSSVSGGITGTTDWQSASYKVISFKDCSPTTGCAISFDHQLRRGQDSGTKGWTDYTVERISNLTSGDRGIKNTEVTSGRFDASSSAAQTVSSSGPFTLYPGMVVCEMLTFRPSNRRIGGSYDYSDITTTVCASATGNAQPEDPPESKCTGTICENDPDGNNGSTALVDIEVKNTTVTKYNTYRRVVYGKPGDTLEYLGSYNPKLQYTYDLRPEQMKFGNDTISNGPTNPCMLGNPSFCQINGTTLTTRQRSLFNEYVDPDWNNDFLVRSLNFVNSFSKAYGYDNGLISAQKETNSHTVLPAEVGCRDVNNPSTCSLNENAEINYPSNNDIKTTPVQVTFTNNGTNNLGTVMTDNVYRTAYARIPYNYKTEINLPVPTPEEPEGPEGPTVDPGDSYDSGNPDNPTGKVPKPEIVYAGENKPIDIEVKIKPKGNSVTNNPGDSDYATKTGKSTVKVIVYLADDPKSGTDNYPAGRTADLCRHFGADHSDGSDNWKCSNYQVAEKELNEAGNLNGNVTEFQPSFNVPDLDAGKKICVAAAIFPSNSGDDANWNSADGSNGWRISDSRCFVVAKKPNLQVLGSNMFSAGRIFTSVAEKRNVYGFYPVMIGGNGSSVNTTVFGSWVEQGIVGLGQISGLASGASTGYFGRITSTTPKNGLGGSKEGAGVSYCRYRVPLSIANYTKTKLGGVPEQICPGEEIVGSLGNGSSLKQDSGDKDKLIARFTQNTENTGIEYTKTEGDYTIGLTEIPVGIIKVVHASGSITITDDLIYGTKDRNTGIIKEHVYAKLADIPKLVIYAEKNIYIGCNVKRIDAVLIAGKTNTSEGVINTCPTVFSKYTGDVSSQVNWKHNGTTLINSAANSNQLKINGTIIANRLIANRTYGAGKGRDSVEPAEIIDYDTTLYGWGMRESEASASGRLQTVYLHEVAPRY